MNHGTTTMTLCLDTVSPINSVAEPSRWGLIR